MSLGYFADWHAPKNEPILSAAACASADTTFSGAAMAEPSAPPVFIYGRIAFWVVFALMAASVLYAASRALANWSAITV